MALFALSALIAIVGIGFILENEPLRDFQGGAILVLVGAVGLALGVWLWRRPSLEK